MKPTLIPVVRLGADEIVNHRLVDWGEAALCANNGQKIDRVIDVEFGTNLPEVLKLIKTGGTIETYSSAQMPEPQLPFMQMMYLNLTIRMEIVYAMPESAKQAAIRDITTKLENDSLQHRIAHQLSFDEMIRAHELVEQGGFGGCVVVQV